MDSIFDQAGEQAKKKEETPAPKKDLGTPPTNEELKKLFEQVYKLNDTVAKKLEQAHQLMGTSPQEIKDYLENPANYKDTTQWANAQKARANLLNRAEKTIIFGGKEQTEKEKKKAAEKGKKKKDDEADKKRKGKTLGSRKGWMSM